MKNVRGQAFQEFLNNSIHTKNAVLHWASLIMNRHMVSKVTSVQPFS